MDFNPVPACRRVGVSAFKHALELALDRALGGCGRGYRPPHRVRTRRHAGTPIRRYAVTLPLPNILPGAPKSVEELSIQVRPDLLDCFYHRLSRFFR
jgi:hypothetical protein